MTDTPLDEKYFTWLYDIVRVKDDEFYRHSFEAVCSTMHHIIFDASVPHDDNRAADGKDLRFTFSRETGVKVDEEWMSLDASLFEVLVGLCLRADFMSEVSLEHWFFIFLQNLNLMDYLDHAFRPGDETRLKRTLRRFNSRSYSYNGQGGLFPLRYAREDQRKIELWYQMSAYMAENHMY